MTKFKLFVLLLAAQLFSYANSAVPPGDTQGKIATVMTWYSVNGANTIRVYFESVSRDVRGCHSGQGYVEVSDSIATVTTEGVNQIFSSALAAKATGANFALQSPPNSCLANVGYIVP